MVSERTAITVVFVCLAVVLWYVSGRMTDAFAIRYAVLVGVGLVAPTLVNEIRDRRRAA